jgi:DNA polymerase I-like protein with 3'-5' exonuclease and polymerase domains
MQRFQVHYMLKEIPEIQDYLRDAFEKSKHHGDLQDLYRRRYGLSDFLKLEQLLIVTF